jgi:hypothetical protein
VFAYKEEKKVINGKRLTTTRLTFLYDDYVCEYFPSYFLCANKKEGKSFFTLKEQKEQLKYIRWIKR